MAIFLSDVFVVQPLRGVVILLYGPVVLDQV